MILLGPGQFGTAGMAQFDMGCAEFFGFVARCAKQGLSRLWAIGDHPSIIHIGE